MMDDAKKIELLTQHIDNVQTNCKIMARELIKLGEVDKAKKLLMRSQKHDFNKWSGIEWENLVGEPVSKASLRIAVHHHNTTNSHHPEYFKGGITEMDEISLMECICDWKARSTEFASDLRLWINKEATRKYKFGKKSPIYKQIMGYVDMICSKPFEPLLADEPAK